MDESTAELREYSYEHTKINEIINLVGLTRQEFASIMSISVRRLQRKRPLRLTQAEWDHFARIQAFLIRGLAFFDGDQDTFSSWLRSPKISLAVPETGYPIFIPANYRQPTLAELFACHSEGENRAALQRSMDFARRQAAQYTKPYPTPLSVFNTAAGIELVEAMLGRINAGVCF